MGSRIFLRHACFLYVTCRDESARIEFTVACYLTGPQVHGHPAIEVDKVVLAVPLNRSQWTYRPQRLYKLRQRTDCWHEGARTQSWQAAQNGACPIRTHNHVRNLQGILLQPRAVVVILSIRTIILEQGAVGS